MHAFWCWNHRVTSLLCFPSILEGILIFLFFWIKMVVFSKEFEWLDWVYSFLFFFPFFLYFECFVCARLTGSNCDFAKQFCFFILETNLLAYWNPRNHKRAQVRYNKTLLYNTHPFFWDYSFAHWRTLLVLSTVSKEYFEWSLMLCFKWVAWRTQ